MKVLIEVLSGGFMPVFYFTAFILTGLVIQDICQ